MVWLPRNATSSLFHTLPTVRATGIALSTLSLAGGMTLLKIERLAFEFPRDSSKPGGTSVAYEVLATIKPFRSGFHDQIETPPVP